MIIRGKVLSLLTVFIAVVIVTLSAGQASSGTVTFNYDYEFSNGTPPAGTAPWLTATFDDSYGDANTVRLTMSASNLVGIEFVDDWLFNFDPNLNSSLLNFYFVSGSAGAANAVTGSNNAYKADGDGYYDIIFDYPPPPGNFNAKFTAGEMAVYDITYSSAINANSFNFVSADGGGQGIYYAAGHVQGIAPDGSKSGWVGVVPEPVSSTLFIIGAATLGFRRLRNIRKG